MLKAKVGHSIEKDSYNAGLETAKQAIEGMQNNKLGFLYTSVKNDIKEYYSRAWWLTPLIPALRRQRQVDF